MVVVVGLANGLEEVEVKPDGLETHEYVSPDTAEAPILTLFAEQMVDGDATFAFGTGLSVTPAVSVEIDVHWLEVVVSVARNSNIILPGRSPGQMLNALPVPFVFMP